MADVRLKVICIIPDDRDPDRRIDSIGVVIGEGEERKSLSLDDAINGIKTGIFSFYIETDGHSVDVEVACNEGTEFLTTENDSWEENNLLTLPHCDGE